MPAYNEFNRPDIAPVNGARSCGPPKYSRRISEDRRSNSHKTTENQIEPDMLRQRLLEMIIQHERCGLEQNS